MTARIPPTNNPTCNSFQIVLAYSFGVISPIESARITEAADCEPAFPLAPVKTGINGTKTKVEIPAVTPSPQP